MANVYFLAEVLNQEMGVTRQYRTPVDDPSRPEIDIVACSGPDGSLTLDEGTPITFDEATQEIAVTLRPAAQEGLLDMFFVATFESGQQIEGSLTLPAPGVSTSY